MVTFWSWLPASAVSNTCSTVSSFKPSLQPCPRKSWNIGRVRISRCPTSSLSTSPPVNRSLMRISTWNDRGKRLIFNTSSHAKALRNSPLIIVQHSPDLHEGCSWKRSRPLRRVGQCPVGYPITEGDLVKEAANNTGLLSAPEAASVSDSLGVAASLRLHWPEYRNGTINQITGTHRSSRGLEQGI